MGYRSDFRLTIDDSLLGVDRKEFFQKLEEITEYTWHSSDREFELYEAKWYEEKVDLEKLSLLYPDVKITCHGRGEDGAEWKTYAFAGRVEVCDGTMVFDARTLWK